MEVHEPLRLVWFLCPDVFVASHWPPHVQLCEANEAHCPATAAAGAVRSMRPVERMGLTFERSSPGTLTCSFSTQLHNEMCLF